MLQPSAKPLSPVAPVAKTPLTSGQAQFRFRLFPLGLFTALFDTDRLVEMIREGCENGYRLVRREFRVEPRRVLFFFKALGFGLMFRRDAARAEPEYDWRVALYKTRFFTRTVDVEAFAAVLNKAADAGFELHFAIKYPTRFLFFFPRESYVMLFRKPFAGSTQVYRYAVHQTPYRFFTRTLDTAAYEEDLNRLGRSAQLKLTFRDERRLLMLFNQPTAVSIFEQSKG